MTLRHLNQKNSEIMREFSKVAENSGFMSSVDVAAEKLNSEKSLDPSNDLIEDVYKLTAGLRQAGFIKQAEELETKFFLFKQAETHLYRVHDEDGDDLIGFAHQDGDIHVQDAKDRHGDVETQLSQHKKIVDVVKKQPTGKLSSASILNRTAQALGVKIGQFNPGAGGPAGSQPVSPDSKRAENASISSNFSDMLARRKEAVSGLKIDNVLFKDADADPSSPRFALYKKYSGVTDQDVQAGAAAAATSATSQATAGANLSKIEASLSGNVTPESIAEYIRSAKTSSGVMGVGSFGIQGLIDWAYSFDPVIGKKYFWGSQPGGRKSMRSNFATPNQFLPDNPNSIWVVQLSGHTYDETKIEEASEALFKVYQTKKKASGGTISTAPGATTAPAAPAASAKVVATNQIVKNKIAAALKAFNDLDTLLADPPAIGVDDDSCLFALAICNKILGTLNMYRSTGAKYKELSDIFNDLDPTNSPTYLADFVKKVSDIVTIASTIAVFIGKESPGRLSEIVPSTTTNDLATRLYAVANKWSQFQLSTEDNALIKDAKDYARTANSMAGILKGSANKPFLFIYAQIKHAFDNLDTIDLLIKKIEIWEKNTTNRTKIASRNNGVVKNSRMMSFGQEALPAEAVTQEAEVGKANALIGQKLNFLSTEIIKIRTVVEQAKTDPLNIDEMFATKGNVIAGLPGSTLEFDDNFKKLNSIKTVIPALSFKNVGSAKAAIMKDNSWNWAEKIIPGTVDTLKKAQSDNAEDYQNRFKQYLENTSTNLAQEIVRIYNSLVTTVNTLNTNAANIKTELIERFGEILEKINPNNFIITDYGEKNSKMQAAYSSIAELPKLASQSLGKLLATDQAKCFDTLVFVNTNVAASVQTLAANLGTIKTTADKVLVDFSKDLGAQMGTGPGAAIIPPNMPCIADLAEATRLFKAEYDRVKNLETAASKQILSDINNKWKGVESLYNTISGKEGQTFSQISEKVGCNSIEELNKICADILAKTTKIMEESRKNKYDDVKKASNYNQQTIVKKYAENAAGTLAALTNIGAGAPAKPAGGGGGGGGGSWTGASKMSDETKEAISDMQDLIHVLGLAIKDSEADLANKCNALGGYTKFTKIIQAYQEQEGVWGQRTQSVLNAINGLIGQLNDSKGIGRILISTKPQNDDRAATAANDIGVVIKDLITMLVGNADAYIGKQGQTPYGKYKFSDEVDVYPYDVDSLYNFYQFIETNDAEHRHSGAK